MENNFQVTGTDYKVMRFPAGEVQVTILGSELPVAEDVTITGSVLSSDHLMELMQLDFALKSEGFENIHLIMPYCAYSRQDRICNPGEAFALKVFTKILNECEFSTITTYDNHSDVSTALLDNCTDIPLVQIVNEMKYDLNITQYSAFVSPDAGANKKVFKTCGLFGVDMIRADKLRDTKTGKILETQVFVTSDQLKDKRILILDDICEGGRTFIELTKALKAIEPTVIIDLFVTHGFFSKGLEELQAAGLSRIYTTNSVREMSGPGLDVIDLEF